MVCNFVAGFEPAGETAGVRAVNPTRRGKTLPRHSWLRRGWWFLLFCLLLASCADDNGRDDSSPSAGDYVAAGKQYLTANQAADAARAFNEALALDPTNVEAQYGLVLAGPMRLFNFIDQIIGTINSISFADQPDDKANAAYEPPAPPASGNVIQEYIFQEVESQLAESDYYYQQLRDRTDARIHLDDYRLVMADIEILAFGGDFGPPELAVIGGLNAIADGLMRLLLAHNFEFDYTKLRLPATGELTDTMDIISFVFELLGDLLDSPTYPNFLYLDRFDGVAQMQQAGIQLGNAGARLEEAFAKLAAEPLNPDAPITFTDRNGNGRFDLGIDGVQVGETLELEPDLALAVSDLVYSLSLDFYEGSTLDPTPNTEYLFTLSELNELLRVLGVLPFELGPITISGFPGFIGIDIGEFFADPAPDGLRRILEWVVAVWENPGDFLRGLLER